MVRKKIILDPREAQLREEIQFWQDLIVEWETHATVSVPDRMRNALALAMYRLELYLSDDVFFENNIPAHGLDLKMH